MSGFEVSMLFNVMSMRQNQVRRYVARGASSVQYIYRALLSLLLSIGLLIMAIQFLGHLYHESGAQSSNTEAEDIVEGYTFCTSEVQITVPLLREAYNDNMNNVLYVGPDTCSVMSELLMDEEDYEAWGLEPYASDSSDWYCWDLIRKGIVRVADLKFPLPYRENSFSHVIVSDTFEYMSPRYINQTIPELRRVSTDGVIIFAGYPGFPVSDFPNYNYTRQAKLRSPSWWKRYLVQRKFEENEAVKKKFKKILKDVSYIPGCQVFLLKSD